jgi:serine/threonine protein kinase
MVTSLMREATILRALTKKKRAGFPAFYKFYKFRRECVLEMELLGPSLEARHKAWNRQFSPSTLLNVGVQTLARLEQLHAWNYIHRDVKPANMATSRNKRSTVVYLLDFGLARQYWDRVTKLHLPANTNHSFVGSRLYSSVNVDLKLAPSRRDDLESWFYWLMEWMHGRLPALVTTSKRQERACYSQAIYNCPRADSDRVKQLLQDFPAHSWTSLWLSAGLQVHPLPLSRGRAESRLHVYKIWLARDKTKTTDLEEWRR